MSDQLANQITIYLSLFVIFSIILLFLFPMFCLRSCKNKFHSTFSKSDDPEKSPHHKNLL